MSFENRARLLPEEKLEALIYADDKESINKLFQDVPHGLAQERLNYLYQKSPARNKELVIELQQIYRGKCQLCAWDSKSKYNHYICQAHHI
ncbi:MAG: hypothetical protein KKH32_10405 [Bacteroidetes bacterium]|nr:hypothetical protein [Bacteroidota bacterium]